MTGRETAILQTRRALTRISEQLGMTSLSTMLTSRSRTIRRFAHVLFALRMLESIRRTKWLYRPKGRVPTGRIDRRAPMAVSQANLEVCRRLIAGYTKANEREPMPGSAEGMWSWIFDTCQRELAATLKRGDPGALAGLMASMFQEDFLLGLASGPLISVEEIYVPARKPSARAESRGTAGRVSEHSSTPGAPSTAVRD